MMRFHVLLLCVVLSAATCVLGGANKGLFMTTASASPLEVTSMPPISINDLPLIARKMVTTYFGARNVLSCQVTHQGRRYLVRLKDKKRIFFDEQGQWTYIDCKNQNVPQLLIPSKIRNQIAEKYGPYEQVVKISRKKNVIKVVLSNEVKLTFEI